MEVNMKESIIMIDQQGKEFIVIQMETDIKDNLKMD